MTTQAVRQRQLRALAWLCVAAYLVGSGISATIRSQGDFAIYSSAAERAIRGLNIYTPADPTPFLYAPVYALALVPFSMLPRELGQFCWFLATIALCLPAVIIGANRMLFGRFHTLSASMILLPTVMCFRFVNTNVDHGQINIAVLAMMVWALVMADEDHERCAGAMIAAAVLAKPFAALCALRLLLSRKFAALGWSALSLCILLGAPVLLLGPYAGLLQTRDYLTQLLSNEAAHRLSLYNQSATAAAARLLAVANVESQRSFAVMSESHAAMVGASFELALLAAVSIWIVAAERRADKIDRRLALSALFCIVPSFQPISWLEYYVALMVPYMALVARFSDEAATAEPGPGIWSRRAILALLIGSFVLNLSGRFSHAALFYSAHYAASLCILGALAICRLAPRDNRTIDAKTSLGLDDSGEASTAPGGRNRLVN